jgi:phage repressor protein C with HTH and peptisase S24 domain
MSEQDDIRQTLDRLIQERGEDYANLSRMLGRNPTYIQQFIKRGVPRKLDEDDRRKLALKLGVGEDVLGAAGNRVFSPKETKSSTGAQEADYVLIPRYNVSASAGDGTHPGEERAETSLAFQTRFAREIASGAIEALHVITVEGDSMTPTVSHGDHILVDTADHQRLRDGVYVIRIDGALMVKRLSVNPATRKLSIKSDNPAYPTWNDCPPESVDIIGRVVWVGRKF